MSKRRSLNLSSAKAFVGQRLNVTLADCAVLVNVKLKRIDRAGRLVFDHPKAPQVRLRDVVLVQSLGLVAPSWDSSIRVQKYRQDHVAKCNAWRWSHRCGALRCGHNRFGYRLLGIRKCASCQFLEDVS